MYLGVPLLHKRVRAGTYAYLEEKIVRKLSGWVAKTLSLAGRMTLARAILSTIPSYTMQTTKLPQGLCQRLERHIRNFVWGRCDTVRRPGLVKWDDMCTSKEVGGAGFKKLEQQNRAFIMKVGFAIRSRPELLWVQVLRCKYGWDDLKGPLVMNQRCSLLWRHLLKVWPDVEIGTRWELGDGSRVHFWKDSWVSDVGPLNLVAFRDLSPGELCLSVRHFVTTEGSWNWDLFRGDLWVHILKSIAGCPVPKDIDGEAACFWDREADGQFSVSSAYDMLGDAETDGHDHLWRRVWKWEGAERVRVFLWLVARGPFSLMSNASGDT